MKAVLLLKARLRRVESSFTEHGELVRPFHQFGLSKVTKLGQQTGEACRRKKCRCNGQCPCDICLSRGDGQTCAFPEANDRASGKRRYIAHLQAKLSSYQSNPPVSRIHPSELDFLAATSGSWDLGTNPASNRDDAFFEAKAQTLNTNDYVAQLEAELARVESATNLDTTPVYSHRSIPIRPAVAYSEANAHQTTAQTSQIDSSYHLIPPKDNLVEPNGTSQPQKSPAWATWVSTTDGATRTAAASSPDGDDVHSLTKEFSYISVDPAGQLRYLGGGSIASLVDATQAVQKYRKGEAPIILPFFASPPQHPVQTRWLPRPEDVAFPPAVVSRQLMTAFFENLHPLYPILDQTAFLARCEREVYVSRPWGEKPDTAFVALVFAVLVLSSKLMRAEELVVDEVCQAEWHERASVRTPWDVFKSA